MTHRESVSPVEVAREHIESREQHRRDSPPPPAVTATRRIVALDGLRGLAALVVVIHHCLLISPALSGPYQFGSGVREVGWAEVLAYTPLHLIWAGPEAVLVFFVLSGFVLTLPFVAGAKSWLAYYPSRLLRLYLPVWVAIGLALITVAIASRHDVTDMSWWIQTHDQTVSAGYILRDVVLLGGTNELNSPLWSLRWEVLFSLLLPIYVYGAIWTRRVWPLAILACLLASVVGLKTGHLSLFYMPVFGVGAVMAVELERLRMYSRRIPTVGWFVIGVAAVLLLTANWTPIGLPRSHAGAFIGAPLLLLLFIGSPGTKRLAETRVVQLLGRWSFSLYLVHEPIVVTVALLMHTRNPLPVLAVSVPLSLLVAAAFYRLVEGPSHRLATHVSRSVTSARPRSATT